MAVRKAPWENKLAERLTACVGGKACRHIRLLRTKKAVRQTLGRRQIVIEAGLGDG